MSRVCVLLAPGFEEIEAVTIIDVLRRADIDTTALGIEGRRVEGSHGIVLHADVVLGERAGETWDMVVLPGGMPGSKNLRDTPEVQALLKRQHEEGGRLAAICAAPIALSAAGVLEGRRATSYPAFRDEIRCAQYLEQPVVVDGTVITSRGPGTAIDFALELVKVLKNAATAQQLAERMLVQS